MNCGIWQNFIRKALVLLISLKVPEGRAFNWLTQYSIFGWTIKRASGMNIICSSYSPKILVWRDGKSCSKSKNRFSWLRHCWCSWKLKGCTIFIQCTLSTNDECWRYNKPKQCHFWVWLKRPIFRVHDSQGSAETLVRRGGITNCHLIAYSFINISAKNYQNRLMCIEVIVCNVTVIFLRHSVYYV